MDEKKTALYKRLNKTKDHSDYVPVVETEKGNYMILGEKVARSSSGTNRAYNSYLESKEIDIKNSRFDKLIASVELDTQKKKGIWFALEGFVDKLEDEDIEILNKSIKNYN